MVDEYLEGIMNRDNRFSALPKSKPSIYLAGPEVFLPDAKDVGKRKQKMCEQYGLVGLFPLDNVLERMDHAIPLSQRIFDANLALMRSADAIIANLTPFRGPGADGGTVFELGFMVAHAKPCFGYSNVAQFYLQKAIRSLGKKVVEGVHVDHDDLLIEDFDLRDNLMIHHGAEIFGAPFEAPAFGDVADDKWRDMRQFERCLQHAAARLGAAATK